MSRRSIQVTVLCEDKQQAVFIRHCLISRGVNPIKIRAIINPHGQGSGEQFVRERYYQEVVDYRRKANMLSTVLVVLLDADTNTVEQRFKWLDKMLADDGQPKRQQHEKIAILIPKRNVETWIRYLQGNNVDETTVYQKLTREGTCKQQAQKLARELCPNGLPADSPPSLHTACEGLNLILS